MWLMHSRSCPLLSPGKRLFCFVWLTYIQKKRGDCYSLLAPRLEALGIAHCNRNEQPKTPTPICIYRPTLSNLTDGVTSDVVEFGA